MEDYPERLTAFRSLLSASKRPAVLTGAGMSTESGIPDFRSPNGLYRTVCSERVFDLYAFERDPRPFYGTMAPLYRAMDAAEPNAGHRALARLAARPGVRLCLATQNIDGLHQRAGSPGVLELHGGLNTMTCRTCGATVPKTAVQSALYAGECPLHDRCGGVLKPDIVFYGEALPEDTFAAAADGFEAADLVIVIGTSLAVYPAADLPGYRVKGCPLVILNRSATPLDRAATLVFRENAGEVLAAAMPD